MGSRKPNAVRREGRNNSPRGPRWHFHVPALFRPCLNPLWPDKATEMKDSGSSLNPDRLSAQASHPWAVLPYLSAFSVAVTEYLDWAIHKEKMLIYPMVLKVEVQDQTATSSKGLPLHPNLGKAQGQEVRARSPGSLAVCSLLWLQLIQPHESCINPS